MLKKAIIFFILLFAGTIFADTEVLHKSEGRIVVRLKFETPDYREGMPVPARFLNFTAQSGSRPQVRVIPQNRFTLRTPNDWPDQNVSPVVSATFARGVPLFSAQISPILSINGDEITYSTEMTVEISYSLPQSRTALARGSFFNAVASEILNPENMENTQILPRRRAPRIAGQAEFNNINARTALRFYIGDEPSSENFNEADISLGAGIYRITPDDLQSLGTEIPLSHIRLRSSNPNIAYRDSTSFAGRTQNLSVTPSIDRLINELNGLSDVPLIIRDKNGDGLFNGNDEILFYAEKIHAWIFDDWRNDWRFLFNLTDFRRYYWISVEAGAGGSNRMEKMPEISPNEGQNPQLQTIGDVFFRANRSAGLTTAADPMNGHGDNRWVWATLSERFSSIQNELFPQSFITNHVESEPARIRFFAHAAAKFASLDFNVASRNHNIVNPNSADSVGRRFESGWVEFSQASQFSLRANFTAATSRGRSGYFDFDGFDLHYRQRLSMLGFGSANRRLNFFSPPRIGASQNLLSFRISDLPTDEFRVLVRHNPRTQQTQLIDSASTLPTFEFSDLSANGFKYHIATQSAFRSVARQNMRLIEIPAPQNSGFRINDLLNINGGGRADYLIIAPEIFLQQALDLARHKFEVGRFESPRVVLLDDILRIFSGGVFSPEAIRNFLVYVQNVWGANYPDYLLLFGAGHFDAKGVNFRHPNHIPLFMSSDFDYPGTSGRTLISFPIEDFFAYTAAGMAAGRIGNLANPESQGIPTAWPQFVVGRIPVQNENEARDFLQKIRSLEGAQGDRSFWRNRSLFVADDDLVPVSGFWPQGIETSASLQHTRLSDNLANIIAQRDSTADIRKVTLFEFPRDSRNRKPQATEALINEINNGVSFVNFFGHGSFTQLADERVFDIENVSRLRNTGRYFVFMALSCVVGYFDDPARDGLSERLLRSPVGAIAAISASRISWADENTIFANSFMRNFLDINANQASVGQAFIASKLAQNIPTYALLGDPSHIPMQNRRILDETAIKILNENREEIAGTLQKMQNIIVRVTLPIPNDGLLRNAEVILQNPENVSVSRKDGISAMPGNEHFGADVRYRMPGLIATRQNVEFRGNVAEIPILIPPTVLENTPGSALRVHVHSREDSNIFSGARSQNLTFSGFDVSNIDINDSTGPIIFLQQVTNDIPNHVTGDRIVIDGFDGSSQALINVRVSDASGVDIFSSQSPGGGISVSIERAMNRRQFDKDDSEVNLVNDDFREVLLRLQISKNKFPAAGEYELTISARDILQNVSTRRFILEIRSLGDEQYTIGDFFAYPSPVRMGQRTRFFFNQPGDNVADISLKIYTLNGRLVRSFSNVSRGVEWDLTDQRGQALSPNVYLYRLFVRRNVRDDGQGMGANPRTEVIRSRVRKMVIHPPR